MPKIIIDIAGLYYHRGLSVPDGATVREAMNLAGQLDRADRANGMTNPILDFAEDFRTPSFLRSISVDHMKAAVSRQNPARTYPAGEYTLRSDPVALKDPQDPNSSFVIVDQEGDELTRDYALTWQYYVYDGNGVDISRLAKGPGGTMVDRRVVPFSVANESNKLTEGGQIVWRAVAIFVRPTRAPSIKAYPPLKRQQKLY